MELQLPKTGGKMNLKINFPKNTTFGLKINTYLYLTENGGEKKSKKKMEQKAHKVITTRLKTGEFIPSKTRELPFELYPYRNSDSEKEGLTIPLKAFQKFGVEKELLKVGARFKIAVVVDGKDELPLIQGHINARGGYITDKVVRHHEEMMHLPLPRLQMGDRRRGSNYHLKVDSIEWFLEEDTTDAKIVEGENS